MKVETLAKICIEAIKRGNFIFVAGNGGSAAEASHFCAELIGRYKYNRRALPAIALTTDTSVLTAISNDFSFDKVFSRQLEALSREGDVLITISTSGTSKNIVNAIKYANRHGLKVISLPTNTMLKKETPQTQQEHLKILHKLAEEIEMAFI